MNLVCCTPGSSTCNPEHWEVTAASLRTVFSPLSRETAPTSRPSRKQMSLRNACPTQPFRYDTHRHTHTHRDTHKHTDTHTHTHAYMHAHMHTHTHTDTPMHACTHHTHTHAHTHHTCTHTHTHTPHTRARTHTHTHTHKTTRATRFHKGTNRDPSPDSTCQAVHSITGP